MTAKRFIVKNIMFDGDCIVDTTDNGYYTTDKQDLENLCELLNELNGENERLKENIDELMQLDVEEKLLKENEQLKTKNFAYLQDIEVFKEENTKLKLENEQLKKDCTALIYHNQEYRKENEELKQTIENICKDYEEAHGMDIRNAEWFTCW